MDVLPAPSPASISSIISTRISWPCGPSKKQFFSLPLSIIYYILKNPSTPEVYIKLIKSCKFFFEGNPIVVIASMYGNTICKNEHSIGDQECCVKFDINKTSSKIWLTHELHLKGNIAPNFVSLLCQKLFRCDLAFLRIEDQVILFDDFKSLISSVIMLSPCCCKIMYKDESPVMLEKIVESLSLTTKHFYFVFDDKFSMANASSMKEIAQLKNFQQLESFHIAIIPEVVSVQDLSSIVKNHETIEFELDFSPDISEDYMDQIDVLIDDVIESEVPNCIIRYLGQDKEKLKIMKICYVDGDMVSDDDEDMDDEEMGDEEDDSGGDKDFDGEELDDEEMEEKEFDDYEQLMEDE